MVPRLLSALDHAARIVVGADATVDWMPRRKRSRSCSWGWHTAHVALLRWWELYLGRFPPTVTCAASEARGCGMSAVQRGALRLLDGGEFHQVSHLAVKIPLSRILRLWQCLQEDCSCGDVLACAKLLGELHVGVVDDVVVDPSRALMCGARGVYSL